MSDDKRPAQVDRILGEVFEAEGRTRAPDRLLEEVFVRTRETKQARRGLLGGVRLPVISGRITPLVIAAVLVLGSLVAIGGVGARFVAPTPQPAPQTSRTPFVVHFTPFCQGCAPHGGPSSSRGATAKGG